MKRIFTGALVMCTALAVYGFFNWQRPQKDIGAATYGSVTTMEAAVAVKPRVVYAAVFQQQKKQPTVAEVVVRYVEEMDGGVKPLTDSHRCTLGVITRMPMGALVAEKVQKGDVIAMCRQLASRGLMPSTSMQYVTYLSGAFKYASAAWVDCDKVSDKPIADAKTFLKKHRLIGKSTPRERRPTPDELMARQEFFEKANAHPRNKIDMVVLDVWQIASGRRLGETCRLKWEHWNRDQHTILVERMKDPRRRDKAKVVALTEYAQAVLEQLHKTRNPDEPRIFPYNAHSVSAKSTAANHALKIVGLRLHDSRREASSRLVEGGYSAEEAIQFTGHETPAVFLRTYMKLKPELVAKGPASMRLAA